MTTTTPNKVTAMTAALSGGREPMLRKRIGQAVYLINVRYSPAAAETVQDKILRLIESEVRTSA